MGTFRNIDPKAQEAHVFFYARFGGKCTTGLNCGWTKEIES
jgi:hypothetical protein